MTTYCPKCKTPLKDATLQEAMAGRMACHFCNSELPPHRSVDDIIADLISRVEYLEEEVKQLRLAAARVDPWSRRIANAG